MGGTIAILETSLHDDIFHSLYILKALCSRRETVRVLGFCVGFLFRNENPVYPTGLFPYVKKDVVNENQNKINRSMSLKLVIKCITTKNP